MPGALASPDRYSDLSHEDARIWDTIIGFMDEVSEDLGIDFRPENNGGAHRDTARIAAENGSPMMAEPKFGGSRYRYSGDPGDGPYSPYLPEQARQLLAELEAASPHFLGLPGDEGSVRELFFEELLEPVRRVVADGRVLWIDTDT